MKQLIPLQHSNAYQESKDGQKGNWIIRENQTDRELFILSSRICDQDMLDIRKFAKQYELNAFNAGINFQKSQQNEYLKQKISELTQALSESHARNILISTELEYLTEGNTNGHSSAH